MQDNLVRREEELVETEGQLKELVRQCEETQVALEREKAQYADLEREKALTVLAQNKVTERA